MTTLIRLLIAHAFGDLKDQTSYIGLNKSKNSLKGLFALFGHAVIVAGWTWLLMVDLSFRYEPGGMIFYFRAHNWIFYMVLISHFWIDFFSSREAVENKRQGKPNKWTHFADQFCHFGVMIVIWTIHNMI